MAIKYTAEQESELYDKYKEAVDSSHREQIVLELVEKWGKPKRSLIAKLSKMGIYVSKVNQSKLTGKKPKTKEQLVTDIEAHFDEEVGTYAGLEKAPKMVLLNLLGK